MERHTISICVSTVRSNASYFTIFAFSTFISSWHVAIYFVYIERFKIWRHGRELPKLTEKQIKIDMISGKTHLCWYYRLWSIFFIRVFCNGLNRIIWHIFMSNIDFWKITLIWHFKKDLDQRTTIFIRIVPGYNTKVSVVQQQ